MIHKLDFDEFEKIDYHLIAIHTLLEDYRLAYFINLKLDLNLSLEIEDIQIHAKKIESKFSRSKYYENETRITWNLIPNKTMVVQKNNENNQNLFFNQSVEVTTKVFLLPEFKKVDYFLKIDNIDPFMTIHDIQNQLNTIENIATAYTIETDKIKTKNNLIF